jgi:carbon-monoxide dehydrogenase medium subunit
VLLIHDAAVIIGNRQGERRMALADFLIDMYTTALEPGDLLLEIEVPRLPPAMKSGYWRLHRYQRPTLGVAVGIATAGGSLGEVRLAVGCAGPKAERLRELETKLNGVALADAGRIVAGEKNYLRDRLRPVDDLLGSAEYKLYMAGVMLTDAIGEAEQERKRNGSRA